MAIDIKKEVNRLSGFGVATGKSILSGQPVELASATTIQPYGTVAAGVLGLAIESNVAFVLANVPYEQAQSGTARVMFDRPSGDLTTQSLFYTDTNRGGLISVVTDGGTYGLYDDGRGAPYDTGDTGWALNGPVYADVSSGLVVSVSGSNPKIGTCLKLPTDGTLVISLRMDA